MRSNPSISVVVPVYNVERFLPACVESVLAQSCRDFEVILVDDESPDGSPALCDRYAAEDARIRVVHKKNGGLGYARNTGIEAARGEYVFFLDSDDLLPPDALDVLLRIARAHRADIVHGRLDRFVSEDTLPSLVRGSGVTCYSDADSLKRVALCSFSLADEEADAPFAVEDSACGALFRLDFLRRHNLRFFSERDYISEDYIFNYQCALRARTVCQTDDTVYHYRVNPESLTRRPRPDTMERVADYCRAITEMMRRDGFTAESSRYAAGYALSRIRAQYKYMCLSTATKSEKLQWADENGRIPYFTDIQNDVAQMRLSRLHRLSYRLFLKKRWRMMFALIKAQDFVRRRRGVIQ